MIRQPEQVTADLAAEQLTQIMKKKENRFWNEFVSKNTKKAGPCKLVTSVLLTQKQKRLRKCKTIAKPTIYQLFPTMGNYQHREIYLSDPRKDSTRKSKTVLRWRVAKTNKRIRDPFNRWCT